MGGGVASGPGFRSWNPFLVAFLCLLTLGVFYVIWYYVTARDLRDSTGSKWSVELWTILLLVPVVNFGSAYKLADQIRRAQVSRGVAGMSPVVVFLWLVLPFGVLLPLNAGGVAIAQYQSNKVWRMPKPAQLGAGVAAPEVLPWPGTAVLALAFAFASVPLAITGPAGAAAGLLGLHYRRRFVALERASPGHRGARLMLWVPWVAWAGVALGLAWTALLIATSSDLHTAVAAK